MINISKSNIHTINELGFLGRGSIECLAWTPDGQTLAVSAWIGIWLYNLKQPQQAPNLLYRPKLVAGFIAIHPSGELLAVNDSSSDALYIWDLKKNEVISVLEETSNHSSQRLAPAALVNVGLLAALSVIVSSRVGPQAAEFGGVGRLKQNPSLSDNLTLYPR
jgi:WD40 repeat protein